MPNALQLSRDRLARAVAATRAWGGRIGRDAATEGPPIKVEPFDAHNASTAAGLINLSTSIHAAARDRANFAAAQQDADLKREQVRAEIARTRAVTDYYARRPAPGTVRAG